MIYTVHQILNSVNMICLHYRKETNVFCLLIQTKSSVLSWVEIVIYIPPTPLSCHYTTQCSVLVLKFNVHKNTANISVGNCILVISEQIN